MIKDVVEYPEEGFAILSDSNGRFLAFRDKEDLIELPEGREEPQAPHNPRLAWDNVH